MMLTAAKQIWDMKIEIWGKDGNRRKRERERRRREREGERRGEWRGRGGSQGVMNLYTQMRNTYDIRH
jgi:TnpA family transposase